MSMRCLPIPTDLHFDNTLGAELIGVIIATFLTGISTIQTYNYHLSIPNADKILFRILIAILWVLDFLLLIFLSIASYSSLVTNFANPFNVEKISWVLAVRVLHPTLSSKIDLLSPSCPGLFSHIVRVEFHYPMHVHPPGLEAEQKLSPCGCSVRAQLSHPLDWKCHGRQIVRDVFGLRNYKWLIIWVFTTIAFTDTLIAGILCYYLWKMKSHATRRTESQINTLMRYSLETGAVTSVVAIAIIITYLTMPNNLIFVAIYFLFPKLYHNALMATLNGRATLRDGQSDSAKGWRSIRLTTIGTSSLEPGNSNGSNGSNPKGPEIVTTITNATSFNMEDDHKLVTSFV
ncbi:hypothetical protein C8Q75DRAFT_805342 [Abortiporus biennis]|nr:hypothetical protein C8Q75DRAFT_805342 [Abortiporus biennis]